MRKAINSEGKVIIASEANNYESFFCRICNSPVYYVAGNHNKTYGKCSHFRHFPKCRCIDIWHYDKTQWHIDWQSCFPKENQEVMLEKEGKKHFADVLLPESKVVIEFQHSHISPEEFFDRNDFYTSLGFKLIWVFDVQKSFSKHRIGKCGQGYGALLESLYWDNPINCLRHYQLNSSVEIFLQTTGLEEGVKKDIDIQLLRISRSDSGFNLFTAPEVFSKDEFLSFAYSPTELNKYRFHFSSEELERFGEHLLIAMDPKRRKTVLGCPKAISGSDIFLDECRRCPYFANETKETVSCLKHYLCLSISEAINASSVCKNKLDQIERICFSAIPNEKSVIVNNPIGKTIKELWEENPEAGVIVLLNLNSTYKIKMCRAWYLKGKKDSNYICKIKKKGYLNFFNERKQLLYPDESQFKVLWWTPPTF